jgi:hypothetical protein
MHNLSLDVLIAIAMLKTVPFSHATSPMSMLALCLFTHPAC